jgi:hypothetical protein
VHLDHLQRRPAQAEGVLGRPWRRHAVEFRREDAETVLKEIFTNQLWPSLR